MSNEKVLMVPDLAKPLADRRFPYRAASAEQVGAERAKLEQQQANAAITAALASVDDMVHRQAIRYFATQGRGRVEEMAADATCWLATHCLPRFDSSKNTKLSTFAHSCIARYMLGELRRQKRIRHAEKTITDLGPAAAPAMRRMIAPDRGHDDRIVDLADAIMSDPSRYLTAMQSKVLTAIVNNPGMAMRDIATMLGYRQAGSLSTELLRIRERLAEIDPLDEPAPPKQRRGQHQNTESTAYAA